MTVCVMATLIPSLKASPGLLETLETQLNMAGP